MPKIYGREASIRFSLGMSVPKSRATIVNVVGYPQEILPEAARGAVLYQRCPDWQEEFSNFLQ